MSKSKDRDLTSLLQELDNVQKLTSSLREQLEHTHKDNSILTDDNTFLRKKLLQESSNNHNECVRLESELYQQGQEVERLRKENVGFLKNKREVERKLREETQAFEKDRIVWQERESELLDQVKALQETVNVLAQQNEQASQKKYEDSPPDTPTLGSTSYFNAVREAKNAQRTIKEQDRRYNEITAELDKAKQATTESMNLNKSHVRRIQQLELELSQVESMNRSLMEENEAYQLLLHEKTMKGEFMLNPIMQRNSSLLEKNVVEKVTTGASKGESTSPQDDDNLAIFRNSALAAELDRASILSTSLLGERVHKESDHTIIESKFQEEIKSLQDANKSMRLYINKILNRILEVQGFEELLSSEWKKPSSSNPVTPITGSFNLSQEEKDDKDENKTKKIERRKTVSGWHFRSSSQPQSNTKKDKIITEEPEQAYFLPNNRKSNEDSVTHRDMPKRPLRRNSSSGNKNTKRFSLFSWGGTTKEEERKEDPYMRPMILVQEKERKE